MGESMEIVQLRNELQMVLGQANSKILQGQKELEIKIMERFGQVDVQIARIEEHTLATNGYVGRHEAELTLQRSALDSIARSQTAQASSQANSSAWIRELSPWVLAAVCALVGTIFGMSGFLGSHDQPKNAQSTIIQRTP